nr:hypothetical protein [Tanacetum cinerariifolium]
MRMRDFYSWDFEAGAHGRSGYGHGTVPVGKGVQEGKWGRWVYSGVLAGKG